MTGIRKVLKISWELALDVIAPKDPDIARLESLSFSAFLAESDAGDEPIRVSDAVAILPYKTEIVKKALVEIKERENRPVARLLGRALHTLITHIVRDASDIPIIIPIPITRKKKRERGWNQCELIADGLRFADIDRAFEIRTDILEKIRETDDQVGKDRMERFENVRNTFAVPHPEKVRGRNVIVFDDIVTTGATLGDARRALLAAGAQSVVCAALAA